MSKIEQLTQAATALSEDQIDDLIGYAKYVAGRPLYYSAPADVLASVERGLAEHAAGTTASARDAFACLHDKFGAART